MADPPAAARAADSGPHLAVALLGVALLGLGTLYAANGLRALARTGDAGLAYDLKLRWVEQHYVLAGRNSADVFFANKRGDVAAYERETGRRAGPLPGLGVPRDGPYPPWAYVLGTALFWPPWPEARLYWAAVNGVALAGVVAWAAGKARGAWSVLLAGGALACGSYANALSIGQAGIVVLALLVAALVQLERGRDVLGGLLLGLAMFKPTTAAPFVFAALVAGRWRAAVAAGVYVAAAAAAVGVVAHTSPLEMTRQMLRAASRYVGDGTGPVNWLLAAGLGHDEAGLVAAGGVFLLAAAALVAARRRPVAVLFAIAAVACRLWTYHRAWDDNVMVLLLVPLLVRARQTRRPGVILAALAVGLSLWVPSRFVDPGRFRHATLTNVLQVIAWVAGAAALALGTPARAATEAPADDGR